MEIQLNADIKIFTRELRGIQKKQIPFAVSKALNATAFDVQNTLKKALGIYLDRPTKYTISALRVKKSDKKKELIADVGFAGGGGFNPPKGAGPGPAGPGPAAAGPAGPASLANLKIKNVKDGRLNRPFLTL